MTSCRFGKILLLGDLVPGELGRFLILRLLSRLQRELLLKGQKYLIMRGGAVSSVVQGIYLVRWAVKCSYFGLFHGLFTTLTSLRVVFGLSLDARAGISGSEN